MKKIVNFVKESIDEFKKVQWPSGKQTVRLTALVIGVSLAVGVYVSVLDLGYKELLNLLIR